MYQPAGPTWKISKRTQAEIREIHRTLPVMLLFLLEKAMSMDPDKDMLAPLHRDGIYVRIWENEL
jgi:hypothetical protein